MRRRHAWNFTPALVTRETLEVFVSNDLAYSCSATPPHDCYCLCLCQMQDRLAVGLWGSHFKSYWNLAAFETKLGEFRYTLMRK